MRFRALLLFIGLLLAACGGAVTDAASDAADAADGGDDTAAGAPAPSARSREAPADDASPAAAAPFGEVTTLSGEQLDGAELAGRDLALWFWAPW